MGAHLEWVPSRQLCLGNAGGWDLKRKTVRVHEKQNQLSSEHRISLQTSTRFSLLSLQFTHTSHTEQSLVKSEQNCVVSRPTSSKQFPRRCSP